MTTLATRIALLAVLFALLMLGPAAVQHRVPAPPAPAPAIEEGVLAAYTPEVRELLRTTYLGHAANRPDSSEPLEVLKAYLALNAHLEQIAPKRPVPDQPAVVPASYRPGAGDDRIVAAAAQSTDTSELDAETARWRELVDANPESRLANFGLATIENAKADLTSDRASRRAAAGHFVKAADIALEHGQVRHTLEVSRVLVALNDAPRLDAVFGRILKVAPAVGEKEHYLALVDYADGLARLKRRESDSRFEEAIRLHPINNVEAINRYAQYLLARRDAARALAILEEMTPDQRLMSVLPVFLRKRALEQRGGNTSSADAEIALLRQRAGDAVGGVARPELTGEAPTSRQPAFQHSWYTDDCRSPGYNGILQCSTVPAGGWCWYPFTVNLGEVIFNEARGEAIGAQAEVAWTVRDRVFQRVSCDTYVGGINYYPQVRDMLPCDLTNGQSCPVARGYCWAVHGGTLYPGQAHSQFNDAHQLIDDLANSGTIYRSFYVINGWMWDRSTNFVPPSVWNCVGDGCGTNVCYSGSNVTSASPNGPMEYLAYPYRAAGAGVCKMASGNVCGNGGGDNYFWNRIQ